MLVSLIAAMDQRGLIGDKNGLPWHLPKDLRRFRAFTWGKPIIMGRRTFESLGKPLPGRFNIVLSQNTVYHAPGCQTARTFQEALSLAEDNLVRIRGDEVLVVGGGKVYAEAIHCWDRAYLTVVEGQFEGGTFFPLRELLRQSWRPICQPEMHSTDEKNLYGHSFHIIERIRDAACRSPQRVEDDVACASAHPERALEGLSLGAILARRNMGL